ncbi:MAG: OmpH family outer membrane protein [Puniceicoccales bacterium]|jgi:Skp family chaperone for outer membrane proteins|nr:OmpH family outer membrane protein [Puniceicoccales bacterium]
MNQLIKRLGLSIAVTFASVLNIIAESKDPQYTIYTVNMAEVYDNFYKGKEARNSFEILTKQAQDEVEKMMQEGRNIIEKIQSLQEKLNSVALDERAKEPILTELNAAGENLHKKEIEINQFRQDKDDNLTQKRQAVLSEHFKELNAHIANLAKQKGADFVLNSAGMGVLYTKPEYDLTQEVIEIANKPVSQQTSGMRK